MENLNLTELLKDAPKGLKLYSPVCGECELAEISRDLISVVANEETKHLVGTNDDEPTFYKID